MTKTAVLTIVHLILLQQVIVVVRKHSSLFTVILTGFSSTSTSFQLLASTAPSFRVDEEKQIFLKDGQPFRYVSGTIHYYKVPHEYWNDRIQKLKASGANVMQT